MSGTGHPLPGSDEARHNQIPEHLEEEKGRGDDAAAAIQPAGDAVAPDGETYPSDAARYAVAGGPHIPDSGAPGRGEATSDGDDIADDQAAHQDRGQSAAVQAEKSD